MKNEPNSIDEATHSPESSVVPCETTSTEKAPEDSLAPSTSSQVPCDCCNTVRTSKERPVVTIFGAGIAGLTAAHELAERGFRVQVVEPKESLFEEGACEVGGVAATQWCFIPDPKRKFGHGWSALGFPYQSKSATEGFGELKPAVGFPYRIYYRSPVLPSPAPPPPATIPYPPVPSYEPALTLADLLPPTTAPSPPNGCTELLTNEERFELLVHRLREHQKLHPKESLVVYVVGHSDSGLPGQWARTISELWANEVAAMFRARFPDITFTPIGVGSEMPKGDNAFEAGRARNNRIELQPAGYYVAAEHGYRFFPSFYRNLDDTMERTPIFDAGGAETGRTALSQLRSTQLVSIGLSDGESSFKLPRRGLRSFEEFRTLTTEILKRFEYTQKDVALFQLQLFRFLTMCSARRSRKLEKLSWIEYVDGRGPEGKRKNYEEACSECGHHGHDHSLPFSDKFLADLDKLPQAMAGMRAAESDALTNGNITIQMLLDQLSDGTRVDRLLDGPTSTAWMAHWKAYLRHQGVSFFIGKLKGLEWCACPGSPQKPNELAARVVGTRWGGTPSLFDTPIPEMIFEDEVSKEMKAGIPLSTPYEPHADFNILALPHGVLREIVRPLPAAAVTGTLLEQVLDFETGGVFDQLPPSTPGGDPTPVTRFGPPAGGSFRDITGIQFYFLNDFKLAKGHSYFADSAWRLTAISQQQFWRERRIPGSRYLGLLSIDIGEMHSPDDSLFRLCHRQVQSSLGSLADQVRRSLQSDGSAGPDTGRLEKLRASAAKVAVSTGDLRKRGIAYVSEQLKLSQKPGGPPPWADAEAAAKVLRDRLGVVDPIPSLFEAARIALFQTLPAIDPALHANFRAAVNAMVAVTPNPEPPHWKDWKRVAESARDLANDIEVVNLGERASNAISALHHACEQLGSFGTVLPVWQCTKREIAEAVWRQVKLSLHEHLGGSIPEPTYFHIDDRLFFKDRAAIPGGTTIKARPSYNHEAYLINSVARFDRTNPKVAIEGFATRPGVLPDRDGNGFYSLVHNRWTPVGGAMKSYTRITSMEHSNESARHAVRAIVHALVRRSSNAAAQLYRGQGTQYGDLPDYWNPEDHECPDLAFLKRVDEILLEEDLPHMVHILGLEEAVVRWVDGRGVESRKGIGELMGALRHQAGRDFAPWIDGLQKTGEPLRDFVEMLMRLGIQR